MIFDPMYLIFVGPAILLAIWAHFRVKSAYAAASQIPTQGHITGAEAARAILDANGLTNVGIEPSEGMLTDHYDPRHKVLRLSRQVHDGYSLASVGIAAHEAGHAIQDAKGYAPLVMRNALVPMAMTGSWISELLIMGGILLMFITGLAEGSLAYNLILLGVVAFGVTVVFQLINLPVEFDASRRAKFELQEMTIVAPQEMAPVNRVLGAAAMTYVAATLAAVLQLLYWLWRLGLVGGRD